MLEPPPNIPESIKEETSTLLEQGMEQQLVDLVSQCNDRYLYWSELKYKGGTLLEPQLLWSIVKETRKRARMDVWAREGIHFALTNAVQRACHEFDMDFSGSWGTSKILPEDRQEQELCQISSIMEEAIASSQMEGAATTREAAKQMLRAKMTPRDKSQRMILNNFATINFIRLHKSEPLTPELIMQVHAMMTEGTLDSADVSGRLRKEEDNIVVGNPITGETVYTPPNAGVLGQFLRELCDFFNDTTPKLFIHPVLRAIIVHFLVAFYHPFVDGNGRTARALFYWHMMKSDYRLVEYLSISRIIAKSKKSYEKSFLYAESDQNDIGYFIDYNIGVLRKSFDELRKYLKRKQEEKKKSERLLHLGDISARQARVLQLLLENKDMVLTAKVLASKFGVSLGTAKKDLKHLTSLGYLQEIALDKRSRAYVSHESLDDKAKSLK